MSQHLLTQHGYDSASTLWRHVSDFVQAHYWTWQAITKAEWHLRWDTDRSISPRETPRYVKIQLHRTRDPQKRRNPATRFVVQRPTFGTLEELSDTHPHFYYHFLWTEGEHIGIENYMGSRVWKPKGSPDAIALIAVEFHVPELDYSRVECFPLYPPNVHSLPTDRRRVALQELTQFAIKSINGGFPLRVEWEDDVVALPGQIVRSQGIWVWKPLFEKWDSYEIGRHQQLDRALAEVRIRVSIPRLTEFCARI